MEGKEILPVEIITALGETYCMNPPDEKYEMELTGGEILLRNDDAACGETARQERMIHLADELVDVAERQLLIHIGTSDAFEEAESLHLVLNSDMRDVEADALICGKIRRRGRGNNRLHALLANPLLPLRLLHPRLIELLLLCRSGDSWDGREGEEGDEE